MQPLQPLSHCELHMYQSCEQAHSPETELLAQASDGGSVIMSWLYTSLYTDANTQEGYRMRKHLKRREAHEF